MLSRARADSSDRFVNETRLTKLARIPRFGDRDIWTNAFAADGSAVAPRIPAEIFKSAAVEALSERAAERHFPTDWSFARRHAAANASTSFTD